MREKKTDMIVFNELIKNGYVDGSMNPMDDNVITWAEKSGYEYINELFKSASKKKTGNVGLPEFIIFDKKNEIVIIIENKKDINRHIYKEDITENVDSYAVNGVLWYASFIKDEYDVVSIACSGTDLHSMLIDTYLWRKDYETFTNLNLHEIKNINYYREIIKNIKQGVKYETNQKELMDSSKSINDFMHNEMNIIEHNRLYVLGSILFALEDPIFKTAYSQYKNNEDIADVLWTTLERKIKGSAMGNKELLINELKPTILSLKNKEKEKIKGKYAKGTLHKLIYDVDQLLYSHYKDSELDLISLFFNTFLSYSTKGGSDLGIVLTPSHITKLFVDIADITLESKILDICAGTGGFLTSAWRRIALSNNHTYEEKEKFRKDNLYGVEIEPSVYTIIALNMFLNKDGRSNLFYGDCFNFKNKLYDKDCNVGFINPPYSNSTYSEISFVELMLDCLLPNSIGIAIVPVNAVSSRTKRHNTNEEIKKRILEKNQLLASIEMPENLFYPKGTETIVLVFETGKKHDVETWLAKFDDGFELIKHRKTRTPTEDSEEKYGEFLKAFKNKEITSFSFYQELDYKDQWVYTLFSDEQYNIDSKDLQKTVNEYISYLFANQYL